MNEIAVKELNAFLEGQYMGVHAYEHYIHNAQDPHLKRELQRIQQEHKRNAARIAERIQNLGGLAADDVGFKGAIQEQMAEWMGFADTYDGILKEAYQGEKIGSGMAEEIVRGDLDPDSHRLIQDVLADNRRHLDELQKMLH